MYYRRNWLLSARAYSNGQQETMRLTASVRLIERTWALRAGPSTVCVTSVKIVSGKVCYGECYSRASRLQDNLAALKREDGNRSDRYAVSVMNDRAIVVIVLKLLLPTVALMAFFDVDCTRTCSTASAISIYHEL